MELSDSKLDKIPHVHTHELPTLQFVYSEPSWTVYESIGIAW